VRLDMRHLQILVLLAECGSISAAARRLGVAQPTLTNQLRRIERSCGLSLFDRDANGVRLTDAGRVVLRHARGIVAQVGELFDEPRPVAGLRLAAAPGVLDVLAPALVTATPEVAWMLRSVPGLGVARAVRDGSCDLAVALEWPHAGGPRVHGLIRWELWTTPLRVLVAEGVDQPDGSGLEAFAASPWVVRSDPDARRALVVECGRAGFVPDIRHTADAPSTVAALVAAGAGVALEAVLDGTGVPYRDAATVTWAALHRPGCENASFVDDLRAAISATAAAAPAGSGRDPAPTPG
jgi:DNA-binding transcriptional LysR family regulator